MLTQQHEQPAITEASAGIGKLAQSDAQLGVRRSAGPVADHVAIGADDAAGPPFRKAELGLQMRDRKAVTHRRCT